MLRVAHKGVSFLKLVKNSSRDTICRGGQARTGEQVNVNSKWTIDYKFAFVGQTCSIIPPVSRVMVEQVGEYKFAFVRQTCSIILPESCVIVEQVGEYKFAFVR